MTDLPTETSNPNLKITEEIIDQPKTIPERPGNQRPLSTPVQARFFPQQVQLEKGKKQVWDSSGMSTTQPFCDGTYKYASHANPSMLFKARYTGFTWLCGCKQSQDAPQCNGTCINIARQNFTSRKGQIKLVMQAGFILPILIGAYRKI